MSNMKKKPFSFEEDEEESPEKVAPRKSKMGTFKNFFGLSKREAQIRKEVSSSAKKLPRNFASKVLDYELMIDSGNFDIHIVDSLMQLYSVSVTLLLGLTVCCVCSKRWSTTRG